MIHVWPVDRVGYIKAISAHKGGKFGEGNGTIWLTKLGCTGNDESSLLQCANAKKFLGFTSRSHKQDAGVLCDTAKACK